MKKIVLSLLIFGVCLTLIGCESNENTRGSIVSNEKELEKINNKIIEYFSSNSGIAKYDNLGFNYVDLTNKMVVVGLIDNSDEQQQKFKEIVIDSEYIEFVQGQDFVDYKKD